MAIVGIPLAIFRRALRQGSAWEWQQVFETILILSMTMLPFLPLMFCVRLMANPNDRRAAMQILKATVLIIELVVLIALS